MMFSFFAIRRDLIPEGFALAQLLSGGAHSGLRDVQRTHSEG
jgi:hypothetical protein